MKYGASTPASAGVRELRTLLPYLRPYRAGIIAGLALVLTANAFYILLPRLLGLAIDALGRPDVAPRVILGFAAAILAAALLSGIARFGMRKLLNGISRHVETDLRDHLFEHLLNLDAQFFSSIRTGELISRATNDLQAIRMAAGPAVMYLVNTLALTAFAVALMLRTSAFLTLLALIPMLILPWVVMGFGSAIHRRFSHIQEHFGQLSTMVQENLAGARVVRAFAQEPVQNREFESLNAGYLKKNMALARTSGAFHPMLALLAGIGMVIVLWQGSLGVMDGTLSIGDFVAFGFYLSILTWPMVALGWVINLFQRGAASMARINQVFAARPLVRDEADAIGLSRVTGELEFRDVWFRYPGTERAVLRGVSFHISAGQTVGLVGPTGSGKSTIVSLLARVYDPTGGEILLDGCPLQRLPLQQLRGAIGFVAQDTVLFSETIAENIAFGLPVGADQQTRVQAAAATARLSDTVAELPYGFATRLSERGANLSGGQRQRTSLARALARDPAILILDDALSAVDTQTETEILDGLVRMLARRTAIIISHRVTAVMHADIILVLDDGGIAETGTHTELVRRDGTYAKLLRRQLLEEGLVADTLATTDGRP